MNKKNLLNIHDNFELADSKNNFNKTQIQKYMHSISKSLKKYEKKKTLVLIKNGNGIYFWMNILSCVNEGYTCFPIDSSYKINELKNYYKTIIILDKKKISIKNLKKIVKNKNILKFNFISATSGSTGKPKLILLNFDKIMTNVIKVKNFCKLKKKKNYLIAIPGYFYSSILHFFTALVSGSKFIFIEEKIFPLDLINFLEKFNVNYFGGPPIHNKWVIDSEKNLTKLEKIFSSGDFLENKTIKKYKSKKNFEFYYMYGITEASGRVCINNLKNSSRCNSVGKPLPIYKLMTRNNDIYIKSNYLFYGYYFKKNFEIPNKNIYITGDQGNIDKNGNIILHGRKDDVFKSSGIKIFTQKIKNTLIESNLFDDVFVYKGKLKNYGNVPFCAYESSKEINIDKLKSLIKNKLDNFHIPKKFKWYKKLPRLRNNKIDRIKIKNND